MTRSDVLTRHDKGRNVLGVREVCPHSDTESALSWTLWSWSKTWGILTLEIVDAMTLSMTLARIPGVERLWGEGPSPRLQAQEAVALWA